MNMISKDIFSRLMTITGINTLTGLSKELGYTENWGTTTRKRGGIPFEACAQISEKHNVSMDYLLYGIDNERKELDVNDLKVAVTEGLFTLIQLKLMEPAEGVKISTMATAITDEIITSCDIEKKIEPKKAI